MARARRGGRLWNLSPSVVEHTDELMFPAKDMVVAEEQVQLITCSYETEVYYAVPMQRREGGRVGSVIE